jgi:hypothetical protein
VHGCSGCTWLRELQAEKCEWKLHMYDMFPKNDWLKMVQACVRVGWVEGLMCIVPAFESFTPGQEWIYCMWQQAADTAMHCGEWRVAAEILQSLSVQPCLRSCATREDVLQLLLACLGCQPLSDNMQTCDTSGISKCWSILLQRLREQAFARTVESEVPGTGQERRDMEVDVWIDVAQALLRRVSLETGFPALQALVLDAGLQTLDVETLENQDTARASKANDAILRKLEDHSQLSLLLANAIWNCWTNFSHVVLLSLTTLAEALAIQRDAGTGSNALESESPEVLTRGQMMLVIKACMKAAAQTADVRMLHRLIELDSAHCAGAVRASLVFSAPSIPSPSSDRLGSREYHGVHRVVRSTRMNRMENVGVLALAACANSSASIGLLLFGGSGSTDNISEDKNDFLEDGSEESSSGSCVGSVEAVMAASSLGNVACLALLDRAVSIRGAVADAALYLRYCFYYLFIILSVSGAPLLTSIRGAVADVTLYLRYCYYYLFFILSVSGVPMLTLPST